MSSCACGTPGPAPFWGLCKAPTLVWKEHTGGHDRIALGGAAIGGGYATFEVKVWDGEAFTVLYHLKVGRAIRRVAAFKSAEGPHRLVVGLEGGHLQVWDPEEGRKLHDGINAPGCPRICTCSSRHRAGNSWPP
jgi:hypothetical protein